MTRTNILAVCVMLNLIASANAEKNATLESKLAARKGAEVTQAFDAALAEPLSAVKGEWTVVDGVLVGKELASDKHAAVLNFQKKNRNSVVRFSFRLDGTTDGFSFSLNHARGHLFRVNVTPAAMTVNLDKDKKDPASKMMSLGSAKAKFEQGKWYTMQVEMMGDKVVAQIDNGAMVEATHPTLDTDKPGYRFVMKGDSLCIDDLHVQELK